MPTRINGNNVTQFINFNAINNVYVNGQQLVLPGSTVINPTDQYTQIENDIHITNKLYFGGTEQTATGAAIPSTFDGTVLKNVNVVDKFALGGRLKYDGGTYQQNRVRFNEDATLDYLDRGTLLGAADIPEYMFSCWVEMKEDGADNLIHSIDSGGVRMLEIIRNSSNQIVWNMRASAGGAPVVSVTGPTVTVASGLTHILIAYSNSATANKVQMYVNDTLVTSTTAPANTLELTQGTLATISGQSVADEMKACIGDVWFINSFLDIDIQTNREKFIDASGDPVDLGNTGTLPTGGAPLIFFGDGQTSGNWNGGQNLGTGGAFAMTGSVTDC